MPENSSSTTGSSSWDEVDEYLYRCLNAPDESVEDRLAAACEERPDLAPALRRRFDVLRNLGFEGPTRWHADAAPGDRFGDHLLLQRIGGGGMGVVYLARQEKLGREVALKLLRGAISEEPAFRERFLREARSVSQLRHPAICRILELGEHEGTPYFSMEYVPGQSLAEFLREERAAKQARRSSSIARQDLVRRVTWLRDIALALEEAHRAGVIHRDIKPSNILIDESGQARLIDFGLAHDGASSQDLTMSGEMLGTPGYMAPEQLRGDSKRVGPETDVFGLGATLFEIVTLERPHSASGRVELIQKTLHEPISNPRSLNPRLDHELCAVIEKALEKEPPRRYRSAARFAEDLQRWLDGKPVLARRPSALRRSSRWVRRNPLPTLLGGVLLSSSLVIGYFLNDAQNSLRIARALALVDTARQANEIGEPQTAGRLAYAAYELDPTPTTLGALQQSLATIAPSQRIEAGGPVWYCAYSPDSRLVLGAGQGGKGVLASVDGTKIAELQTESTKLWCFAFGPTNDVLIGGRGEARIFDCEGALRGTIPVPENSEAFTAACFGPAGERILLGDDIGRVHVHRVEDGQRVATFARAECSVETHFDAILQLRLHPSGERFVSTDYCGSICLRELDSGKVLARHGEQPAPTDAILLPDATDQLCYADRHGHVHIWDFGKNELSRFGEDLRWYTGLAATPDGKYLAGSGYLAQVEVYRRDGQLQTVIPHDAGVWDCEFSPDGTRLATCTDSGVVRIFDLGGVLLRELRGHRASINQMRWSPDGRSILTASQDGELRIWYLDRDELPMLSGHRSEVLSVFPLRSGGFVSGDSCGSLNIWSDAGQLEKSIDLSPSRLEALAYTQHSDAFFASLTPGVIASWSPKGELREPVLRVQDQTLGAFALADGRLLVVLMGTNDESSVFEYYRRTAKQGWVTAGERVLCPSELGRAVCSSFLGDTLTILHQGEFITQWDVSGTRAVELGRYPMDGNKARIVAATGEGRSLFLCGEDSVLRLFEPGRGIVQEFIGHERAVTSAVLSPDGQRIASTSRDGTVRVWDRQGAELMMLRSENGTAHCAVFSEDGRRILVGYSGCVARFWYHQVRDVKALATRLLGRLELGPEELRRYRAILDG